jgi:hypothetical protein
MNSLKVSLILAPILGLTACGAYQEHFKCKAQPGLGCSSITEVNDLVNQGWPTVDKSQKASSKKESFFSRLFKAKSCKSSELESQDSLSHQHFLNQNPSTLRIWMAPYKAENQYCGEQFVYSGLDSIGAIKPESFNNQPEAR